MRRHRLLALLAVVVASPAARPADAIDAELAQAAKQVRQFLAGRAAKDVRVLPIRNTSEDAISHGPGLCVRLRGHLAEAGLTIAPDARYGLSGEYSFRDDARTNRQVIQLDMRVVDVRDGHEELLKFSRSIFGEDAIIDLIAPAAIALPPGLSDDKREEYLVRQIDAQADRPSAVIDGSVAFAGQAKAYGVEVRVKTATGYAAKVPTRTADGDLYVDLKHDDVFVIGLHNRSGHEAAATVTIDGLDTFSFGRFADVGVKPRWVIPAGKTVMVRGWPIDVAKSHEFLVTEYAKSALAELGGDKSKVGVFTVKFAAAWPKDGPRPADEADLQGSRGSTGVGRGALADNPLNKTERTFGRTRAVVSVRYHRD